MDSFSESDMARCFQEGEKQVCVVYLCGRCMRQVTRPEALEVPRLEGGLKVETWEMRTTMATKTDGRRETLLCKWDGCMATYLCFSLQLHLVIFPTFLSLSEPSLRSRHEYIVIVDYGSIPTRSVVCFC